MHLPLETIGQTQTGWKKNIAQERLESVAGETKVRVDLLSLLPPRPPASKSRKENE